MKKEGVDTKIAEQLARALKKMPVARVGVLGSTTTRASGVFDAVDNAQIGAFHEFGTSKLPMRSFLRMPITEHLNSTLAKSGAFKPHVLNEIVAEGSGAPWMKKVALVAEGIVLDAFKTGGFGKWRPSNMTDKQNKQTLVETQQLMKSITSEVK